MIREQIRLGSIQRLQQAARLIGMADMTAIQHPVSVDFFGCSWEKAWAEVLQQRPCDQWVYGWPGTDDDWLFGNDYGWMQPLPDYSPLARRYYDQITGEINAAIQQALDDCESQRYTGTGKTESRLRLTVSSCLIQGGVTLSVDEEVQFVLVDA